ncbi:UNVERIFIED_CONTAM: hypothetical protein K2H54_059927 [Gekko kuhli]
MGVKGLLWFVTNACPGASTVVNLKEMAENQRSIYSGSPPIIVVDAMSCLRQWYTPESWVCGGQWQEYLSHLNKFISTFTAAGIKLVFYFDGVVEQKKRDEWVKRRLKNNKEIAKIFQFIKTNKQQPGRQMFFIPSGLATFTRFALKSLDQEQSPWLPCDFSHSPAASVKQVMPLSLDEEIFQKAKEQHVGAESYMVYNVLSSGEVECSNTLEDEYDIELPGQAHIYRLARQHIYSVLLESGRDIHGAYPIVKEWFVCAGNSLQQPDLIHPRQLPGGTPNLRTLWLSRGPEAEKLRCCTFLACFQLQDVAEELQALQVSVAAVCSLLIYLALQVDTLSVEDLNAFVAQTLCLEGKSAAQLADLQVWT